MRFLPGGGSLPAVGRVRFLLAAALCLAVAGCSSAPPAAQWQPAGTSSTSDKSDKSEKSGESGAAAEEAAVTVPETLKFNGRTLDGKAFDASTLAGKPVLLWFWAPWCATCASEAQSISDIAIEYQDRLNILGIAGMGDNKAMQEFVDDFNIGSVPHLDDQAGKIWKRFKITEQSLYVVIDRTGKVLGTGYMDDLQLTRQVKSLVA